ncbi:hypothetical protein VHN57_15130 [Sphingobium sp. WW5]
MPLCTDNLGGNSGEKLDRISFQCLRNVQKNQHVHPLVAPLNLADVTLGFANPLSEHGLMQPDAFSGFPNNTGDDPSFFRISWSCHQVRLIAACVYSILEYKCRGFSGGYRWKVFVLFRAFLIFLAVRVARNFGNSTR